MTSELKSMLGENYAEQAPIPSQNMQQKELERKTKDYIKKLDSLILQYYDERKIKKKV